MEVKPGYKQTEVGVIPEGWQVKRIDQVADANWGNTAITKDSYREAGYPAYSASGLDGFVSWFDHDKPAVILSAIGAQCGKTWFATDKWTAIKNTIWIRGEDGKATSEFIYRVTGNPSFWPNRGQAQPFIALGDVRAAKIPVPLLPEQRAIAAALSDVDALLGGLDRLIAKKRDLKQAAMQQLLTGQTRLPGFSGAWEETRFDKVVRHHAGNSALIKGKLPPSEAAGLFPAYSASGQDVWCDHFEHEGDAIVVSAVGSRCGKAFAASGKWCAIANTHVVWPNPAKIDRRFLGYFINDEDFWQKSGTGQPFVLFSKTFARPLHLPALPEQTAIAAVLSDMDAELTALEARRDKTRDLKQAMMQELLTGKTRLVKPEAAHA